MKHFVDKYKYQLDDSEENRVENQNNNKENDEPLPGNTLSPVPSQTPRGSRKDTSSGVKASPRGSRKDLLSSIKLGAKELKSGNSISSNKEVASSANSKRTEPVPVLQESGDVVRLSLTHGNPAASNDPSSTQGSTAGVATNGQSLTHDVTLSVQNLPPVFVQKR